MSIILENPHQASCANPINLYTYDLENKSYEDIINDFDIDEDVVDNFPFDDLDTPKLDLVCEANSSRYHSTEVFNDEKELAEYYDKIRNYTRQHNILYIQAKIEKYLRNHYEFDIENEPLEYLIED